jgi:hypothetical protein
MPGDELGDAALSIRLSESVLSVMSRSFQLIRLFHQSIREVVGHFRSLFFLQSVLGDKLR